MGKYRKIKALKTFFWKGKFEQMWVNKGDIIEADTESFKQLVEEEGLCESLSG